MPRVTSGKPKRASSAATITSQVSASSKPPPSAQPSTAATSGFLIAAQVSPPHPGPGSTGSSPARERLQVHAGAEGAAGAGDDADGQSGILVQRVQSGGELLGYLMVDGVHLRGAVDRHRQDAVLTLSEDDPGWTGGGALCALPSRPAPAGGGRPRPREGGGPRGGRHHPRHAPAVGRAGARRRTGARRPATAARPSGSRHANPFPGRPSCATATVTASQAAAGGRLAAA